MRIFAGIRVCAFCITFVCFEICIKEIVAMNNLLLFFAELMTIISVNETHKLLFKTS